MGWSHGVNPDGREVGYGVAAVCDHAGCQKTIDRGLAYVCGVLHGGSDWACGGYFCADHLWLGAGEVDGHRVGQLCSTCMTEFESAHPEPDADELVAAIPKPT